MLPYTRTKRDKAYSLRHDSQMAIPFRDVGPDETEWRHHAKRVDRCRGAACFSALALHFGTSSPAALERLVDGRERYLTAQGDRSSSGKYRQWWRDGYAPSQSTIDQVRERSGRSVDLGYWKDLPLWRLLGREPPAIEWLHKTKEAMPQNVRKVLFIDGQPTRGRFIHMHLERDDKLRLRDLGTLDAFIALLCIAREGEILGHDPTHFLPTACAFDMLPRVLSTHRQLNFRWETLFQCMETVFFSRIYGDGIYFDFDISHTKEALKNLESDPQATWPQLSGSRDLQRTLALRGHAEQS